ncbi:MAG TPA: hypothetical protein VJH68_04305 [Candidatus Nanoarchaeia archaeon]|nr:hypothetical protein [Candidatus Nanoarchaeia archaeon]
MINQSYRLAGLKLQKSFRQDKIFPHLCLYQFFNQEYYQQLKAEIKRLNFKKSRQHLSHSCAQAKVPLLLNNFLLSQKFQQFLFFITGNKVKSLTAKAYQFGREDYLILNDRLQKNHHAEITLDLTNGWDKNWGGSISYANGKGEVLALPIKENTFTIIELKRNVNRYVKYINHYAKNKKRVFCLVKLTFFKPESL